MQKTKTLVLLLALVFLVSMPAFADTTIKVDGKESILTTINHQNRLLIPLRDTANLLGAKVNYLSNINTAYIERYGTVLRVQMGDAMSYLNDQMVSSGVPPVIVNGKAYVPLRFLAESMNYQVDFKDETVQLTSKPLAKVHFIDVGFGDAIYIQLLNNKNILIDTGNQKGGGTVATYLRNQGVQQIDLLVASAPREEHMGGIGTILRAFKVNKVIDTNTAVNEDFYQEYKEELSKRNVPLEAVNRQKVELSGVTFEIYNSYKQMLNTNLPEKSIISALKVGEQSFLFMSDYTGQNETKDLPNQRFDILKVANHAGINSTGSDLLKQIKPEVAVITVDNSKPGFPRGTTLKRISDSGAKLYSTGANGNIVIETDGRKYNVNTQYNRPVEINPEKDHGLHLGTELDYGKFQGDMRTGIYHHPNCEEIKHIEPQYKVWFYDKLHAENNGYIPDEVCNPK